MSQLGELQGFINVKIPSRITSRSFIPWKTWKRQWVVVRRSKTTRNGVELLIGRASQNILQISVDDIICRTESRTQYYAFGVFPHQNKRRASVYLSGTSETDTQKWISTIRKLLKPPLLPVEENEFSVSIIDNFFSRSAGLAGLYGTLRIASDGVSIVDPCTSKNKVKWAWETLSQFHVSSTITEEDKGHICTIVTSRTFPGGVGPIHLFCTESVILTRKLKSKGGKTRLSEEDRLTPPHRHHTFSHCFPSVTHCSSQAVLGKTSPVPKSFLLTRRLSRSEGNLMSALRQMDSGPYGFLDSPSNCLRSYSGKGCDSDDKVSVDSSEFSMGKGKVASSIISAGLGLILSTPGGSEGDSESLHEYQKLQHDDSDDDLASLPFSMPASKFSPPRRESGISMASGVYEEIDDMTINLDFSTLNITDENDLESPPPPIPPRREFSTKNYSAEDFTNVLPVPLLNRFLSKSAENTPSPSPPCCLSAPSSSTEALRSNSSWSNDECDYLPMLPSCGLFESDAKRDYAPKESLDEQHYMVMASIKGT